MPTLENPTEWPEAAKAALTRKIGPLHVWGWVAIASGGGAVIYLVTKGTLKLPTSTAAVTTPVATAVAGGFAGNYGTADSTVGGTGGSGGGDTGTNPPVAGGVADTPGGTTDSSPSNLSAPAPVPAGLNVPSLSVDPNINPSAYAPTPLYNIKGAGAPIAPDTNLVQNNASYLDYVAGLRTQAIGIPGSKLVTDTTGKVNLLGPNTAIPAGWQVQGVSQGGAIVPAGG